MSNSSDNNKNQSSKIKIRIYVFLIVLLAITVILRALYGIFCINTIQIIYVTVFTVFYHFAMRIFIGESISFIFRNREFHYNTAWYKQHKWEIKLYDLLQVKRWKRKVITAEPERFDTKQRTYRELLHSMTQAEIVHEIIMVLSFVPLLFIIPYGYPAVFIITSIIASLIDLIFVIIQRYNRPRLLKIIKKAEQR